MRGYQLPLRHVLLLVPLSSRRKLLAVGSLYWNRLLLHDGFLGGLRLCGEPDRSSCRAPGSVRPLLEQAAPCLLPVFCDRHVARSPHPRGGLDATQVAGADGPTRRVLLAAGHAVAVPVQEAVQNVRQPVRCIQAEGICHRRSHRRSCCSLAVSDRLLWAHFCPGPRALREAYPHGQPARRLRGRASGDEPQGILAVLEPHVLHGATWFYHLRLHNDRAEILHASLCASCLPLLSQDESFSVASRAHRCFSRWCRSSQCLGMVSWPVGNFLGDL
mmetsp:Transcript_81470/g.147122  ORF Transcript_81470/g.147122 Transcript_81470/m.147122 type:complete len:274 (-) Transcript_81470:1160-1981(-)